MNNTCWHCSAPVLWGGDFDFEDYGYEGEGVVSNHSCSNGDCGAQYEVAVPNEGWSD